MLYSCGCAPARPVRADDDYAVRGMIDVHCHLVTPEVTALVADRPEVTALIRAMPAMVGEASWRHNLAIESATLARMGDPAARLADMDLMGVALQAVSPAPMQYHHWADRALADRLTAVQNEHIAGLCRAHPGRFVGLGAVAMQHPDLAERQLQAIMANGFKGVEISSRIGERELSDPRHERFWAIAAETGAVIFVHPLGSSLGARLNEDYLANTVGQPVETTVALSGLIFAGVLDRHPALKLLAAHGGGYLPGFLGRSDHAWQVRPEARRCRHRPSDYLRRIWFDTVVHSPAVLANLVTVAGVGQVVAGSDYPYDMGEYRIGELLAAAGMSDADGRNAILFGNAHGLLSLA